jgi:inositol 1,4,5-triphosphate receptor type 1
MAAAETKDNETEYKRRRGKPLVYGEIVQFRHRFTGKFLKVNTSETATLDHSNMRVNLDADASRDSSFRILPRYRIRSEGDTVGLMDLYTMPA